MNLTVSPISTQTTSSQNVSSKGIADKLFGASKKPAKDVFVASAVTTAGMAGIGASNQVQNNQETDNTLGKVITDLRYMYQYASLLNRGYGLALQSLEKGVEKLPQDSTKDFINESMNCIANALENNPRELCTIHCCGRGYMMGMPGRFILKTCENLLHLKTNANLANSKKFADFSEQVQKDVLTSKELMQLINSGDWESTRKINLDSNAVKLGIKSLY